MIPTTISPCGLTHLSVGNSPSVSQKVSHWIIVQPAKMSIVKGKIVVDCTIVLYQRSSEPSHNPRTRFLNKKKKLGPK